MALYSYQRLTLDENYVGLLKVRELGEYSIASSYCEATKGGAGGTTRLKPVE